MRVITELSLLRSSIAEHRERGNSVGFVPTMGNLHAGHLALVKQAASLTDRVVVSIYINPMQFAVGEDLNNYPRTLEQDIKVLRQARCDLVFTPDDTVMYPNSLTRQTCVSVPELSDQLCGNSRPGHFDGVATVVTRLFNMVQPDLAVFGKKDYQQLLIIKRLVADLAVPVEIIAAPTERDVDGLALSSRNQYLSGDQRRVANTLYKTLGTAAKRLENGENWANIKSRAVQQLSAVGFEPEYFELRTQAQLATVDDQIAGDLVILVAAQLGNTRLIDNIEVSLP